MDQSRRYLLAMSLTYYKWNQIGLLTRLKMLQTISKSDTGCCASEDSEEVDCEILHCVVDQHFLKPQLIFEYKNILIN